MGNIALPPEAELTKNPVAGEIINGVTHFYTFCSNPQTQMTGFQWIYGTRTHLTSWGNYQDVWSTFLVEKPAESGVQGSHDSVYNYYWANGYGIVNLVWGTLIGSVNSSQHFQGRRDLAR